MPGAHADQRFQPLDEADEQYDGIRRARICVPNPGDCNFYPVSNRVVTSKYTIWNFIFLNLWDQFQEISNIYFFIIGILQIIPEITTTDGVPDNYIPLSFILFVSGVRAAVDDYAKHKEDNRVASRMIEVYDPGFAESNARRTQRRDPTTRKAITATPGFYFKRSGDLAVGDIIRVRAGESFPSDCLLLNSAHKAGHCFVETASLDGETNLKIKEAHAELLAMLGPGKDRLGDLEGIMEVEQPRKELEQFDGFFVTSQGKRVRLSGDNLLLRETKLKNTTWVHALVVYCGKQTKIRLNAKKEGEVGVREKRSQIMQKVTRLLWQMMILQSVLCLIGAIFSAVWFTGRKNAWYLMLSGGAGREAVLRFFSWFIVLAQFVPISLVVTSEVVKRLQQYLIESDWDLIDPKKGPIRVNNSQINEDLGQVEYIFTDKTGTLTRNKMEFRCAVIGGEVYGSQETEISRRVAEKKRHGGAAATRLDWDEQLEELAKREGRENVFPDETLFFEPMYGDDDEEDDDDDSGAEFAGVGVDADADVDVDEELGVDAKASRASAKAQDSAAKGVQFEEKERTRMLRVAKQPGRHAEEVRDFLMHMAVSNTVNPVVADEGEGEGEDEKEAKEEGGPRGHEGSVSYQSSSPDELALCQFSEFMGYRFLRREGATVRVKIDPTGEEKVLLVQAILPFDSIRKRVTVVYSDTERKRVWVMCKGADSCVIPLLDKKDQKALKELDPILIKMANNGLRTLVVAQAKNKPFSWWASLREQYNEVRELRPNDAERRRGEGDHEFRERSKRVLQARRNRVYRDIELSAGLRLLGATAIEDRLQALVPECIRDFLSGGIKVWMLTGDKRETAKNIAMACNLIEPDMVATIERESKEAAPVLVESASKFNQDRLIEITGRWHTLTQNERELKRLFDTLDTDGSGFIDKGEMLAFMLVLKYPGERQLEDRKSRLEQAVNDLFAQYDSGRTGKINRQQFLKAMQTFQVSLFDAVVADVEAGLHRAGEIDDLEDSPVSMVVEGGHPSALSEILFEGGDEEGDGKDPVGARADLRERFFHLASLCKSVVACRCTPRQKALVIREIKKRKGSCVLAVGDGGNDEPMIKEADVGIGIVGEEGSAAAQASDFAIGQFRFLHPLLFKHGVWLYDRIAIMTLYIFYKAAMVALAMFYYGFFSGFSAHQLFNLWAYTAYNVAFTATPILVVAVLDQTLQASTLENQPLAYRACITRGQLFSTRIFFVWIQQAMVHVALIFFIAFWALESSGIAFSDGKTLGLWTSSTVVYSVIVMVATFRLTLEMRSFTYCHHFWVWFSFFGYYGSMAILSIFPTFNPDLYFVLFQMLTSPQVWFTLILCTSLPLVLDLMVYGVKHNMFPHYHMILRERELDPKLDIAPDRETFVFRHRKARKAEKLHRAAFLRSRQAIEATTALEREKKLQEELPRMSTDEIKEQELRTEAIVSTWFRFQNMSGAIFDGTDDADHIQRDTGAN